MSRLFHAEIRRGPVIDLSRSGVQFRATEDIPVGEELFMALRLPELPESVQLKAQVRWIRSEKKIGIENYTHVVGAEFVEFTPRGWDLIASALKA